MVSEKEVEAAREAWREYWSDVIGQYEDNKSPMEGMRRALTAAARVRAEANAGEPVAWTGSGSLKALEIGRDGFMWPNRSDAHPIPLYLHPAPQPSGPVQVKPLEWSSRYCLHLAYSGFGTYRIEDQGSNWKEDRYWLDHNGERIGKFPTLEAAKSAAQADYERHILSALTAGKPHPDDEAVDRFAAAMKAKLKWEREERGRHGWNDPEVCSEKYLARLLIEHLAKGNDGNFEDVANFCMMLHQRGAHPRVLADALARAEANTEPVAWRYKLFESDPEWTVTTEKPQGVVVEPLFTRTF